MTKPRGDDASSHYVGMAGAIASLSARSAMVIPEIPEFLIETFRAGLTTGRILEAEAKGSFPIIGSGAHLGTVAAPGPHAS
jgi:hypothetical protein